MDRRKFNEEYFEHIERAKIGYELTAKAVGHIIEKMKKSGAIKRDVHLTGRIKSSESAEKNYGNKKLDDCFGLRIVADKEDLEKIAQVIRIAFSIKKNKDNRAKKENEYNALHQMIYLKTDIAKKINPNRDWEVRELPIVELQYWDKELEKKCTVGSLAYSVYKKNNPMDVLKRFKKNPELSILWLPEMYVIEGIEMTKLSKEETLLKLYPELRDKKTEKSLQDA